MSVIYNNNEKKFYLHTKNTSYVMGVLQDKYLLHLYYGSKISEYSGGIDSLLVSLDLS